MAATVTQVEWQCTAGNTVVSLRRDTDGKWMIFTAANDTRTVLPATVTQTDAIDTASAYAVLLDDADTASQAARQKVAAARSYIDAAPRRLANQGQ